MWLNDAIGFLVACLTLARRVGDDGETLFFVFRQPWAWAFRAIGFVGITLGVRIFATEERLFNRPRFVRHEKQHWRQQRKHGASFLLLYLWQWAAVGFRYSRIPFEIEARAAEAKKADG